MEILLQIIVNGLLAAAIYALIAAGISFIYTTTKIFHLAYGTTMLSAGYTLWWVWDRQGWSPILGFLIALGVSVVVNLAMNEFVYEKLRRRGTKGFGYLIATLALLTLGTACILALFGAAPKTFHFQTTSLTIFPGVYITTFQAWILGATVLLLIFFYYLLHKTRLGKAIRATADNESMAEVLGVHTRRVRQIAFFFASLLAGVAGMAHGLEFNLDPNMGVLFAVKGFTAAVIGGAGSFGGTIVGSLLMGILEQITVWFWGAGWHTAIVFLLLFIFLLFKPAGIFGSREHT